MELNHLPTKHLPKFLSEGREAENQQNPVILWDQAEAKGGIDANLNPKDLSEIRLS